MSDELRSRRGTDSAGSGLPLDVLVAWVLLGVVLLVGLLAPGSTLQFLLGVPAVLLLPGYVTVAAAFPHAATAPTFLHRGSVSLGERLALSLALSLVLVPMLGVVVGLLPGGVTQATVGGVLGTYVVLVGAVAGFRRLRVPAEHRFHLPVGRWKARLERSLDRSSVLERLLTLALVCSVLLAVGVAGYAIAVPNDGAAFTDFHLVTEGDDGEAVAAGYPQNLTAGSPTTLTTGVRNHEGERTDYVVVVTLDRVVESQDGRRVVEAEELTRMEASVAPGEEWTETHTIRPGFAGRNLRLSYYLYVGDAPEEVDREAAYRQLHLWVDVERGRN